jgi:ABC-2 type transport system permease protein
MLRDIIRFEWRYHTRQVSFLAAVALFFLFGFATTATGFGPDNVHINSPYSIAQSIGMLSLLSVFILANFCANAVVRDRETKMEEIVFTTSVGKLQFLFGRFTGSFLAALTAFSTTALGMLAARFMPWHDADRLGAVHPAHYLWALAVIAVPNMLFAAATLFALSTVTRSVLASYAGSVLIYVLYFAASALTNSPLMASSVPGVDEHAWLAALLDPFALSAFFEQTRNWTPALRNAKLVSLTGNFLLNRLFWVGAAVAILAVVYRLFSFRVSSSRRAFGNTPSIAPLHATQSGGEPPHSKARRAEIKTSDWAAYLAATRIEIRTFLLTLPFLAMMLLWAGLAGFELMSDITGGEYGSASYPASGMLFGTLYRPLTLLATILLIYASAEIVWRERTLRLSGILHATPASNVVFVASKCTALAALIGVITATGLLTAMAIQLARGWPVEPALMLAFAYFVAAPLLLFAFVAVTIQTLSPHKYLGMLMVLLVGVIGQLGPVMGWAHPLLRVGWVPGVLYSDMNGFGRTARFHSFIVYWAALACLFLLLATALWRHGAEGFRRLRPILRRTPRSTRALAGVMTAVFLGAGAFIFYNTNVLHTYTTDAEVLAWRADYEKTYKTFAVRPQPHIRAITADVDLYPKERRVRVRGEYLLVNDTSKPMGEILVAVRRDAGATSVTIPFARKRYDARFNQHLFTLAQPLPPGGQTTVRFDVTYENSGFESEESPDPMVVENGSYLMSFRSFPTIGYRAGYELQSARARKRHGLPESTAYDSSQEFLPHDELESAEWIRFDLTIATDGDQTAIAPGRLVRAWKHDGRNSFHYRSDGLIPNQFAIGSGRYAVARETHRGVSIEIYHHPEHTQNVARMMRAASESLGYSIDNFGPYPHPHLRLVEVPAQYQSFSGFAQPGVIFLGENRGFLIDSRDPRRLDLLYRRVAHEVAHQWWGHQLVATHGPGATILTESLAKYSEIVTLEKAYGRESVRQLLTYELDAYLAGRTGQIGEEPPLVRADNQSYLYYRKGALVMNALKDLLGERAVNTALRNLLIEQGGPDRRPTTAHLMRHLYAVASPAQHALIDQWMTDVVLYDFTLESATSRPLPNGRHEVKLRITAAKQRADDQPLPMQEMIEIGIFSADDKALHLAKHALHEGVQEITVIVNREPLSAAVDPYVCRIDRNRFDNSRRIENRPSP